MLQSKNPFTSELLFEIPILTSTEITHTLEVANSAYLNWKSTSLNTRIQVISEYAAYLESEKPKLAELISTEMGKNIKESFAEISKCISLIEYYIQEAEAIFSENIRFTHIQPKPVRIQYEPLGVILGVMPWNFPFWQCLRFAIPTLLAGNTIVLKHASNVPQCGMALAEGFLHTSAPKGIFQFLAIQAAQVESVLQHSEIQGVALTGSETAGTAVASIAAKRLIPCILELGGNDPMLVMPDADLDATLNALIASRLNNNGQSCIGAKRLILPKAFLEGFSNQLTLKLQTKRIGNPLDDTMDLGTLVNSAAAIQLENQVRTAIETGGRLITGGKQLQNACFEPTILHLAHIENYANQHELFGPVFSILTYNTIPEALTIANSTPFGLGAMVMGSDLTRCQQIAQSIEAGSIAINDIIKSDPGIPFGGIKLSGYGREMGFEGALSFTNLKSIR